jgi:hypothetical protein
MDEHDDFAANPKHSRKLTKKIVSAPAIAVDAEAKFMKELWLAISVDLVFHPKLICAAIELEVDDAHMLGILVRMWLMTFKYAKDGDLWRGDDDTTSRFVGVVTGYKGISANFTIDISIKVEYHDCHLYGGWSYGKRNGFLH